MSVLFTSSRPLERADNVLAVWNEYWGKKKFAKIGYGDASSYPEDVVVTDEFLKFADKPRQTVIMIGHGLTGGKLYGNDQKNGQFTGYPERMALVDYYITSSEDMRCHAASAAGIPFGRCLPLGMPRTDRYLDIRKKGVGMTEMAVVPRAYLYVPTFRAWYDKAATPLPYEELDEMMGDDELLVVKRHPNTPNHLVKRGRRRMRHILELSAVEQIEPYLYDCDVLVTDFSSAMLDALVIRKPVVLVTDDDGYLTTRGMYEPYPDGYSSRSVKAEGNAKGLLDALRRAVDEGFTLEDEERRTKFAGACDGKSARRVAEFARKAVLTKM